MLLICGVACTSCTESPEAAARPASIAATTATGRGMIVPAYVALGDVSTWNILRENAATVTSGAHPKDYWVVANGPSNGPFTTGAAVWDPLRAAGGVVIGYVHTCTTPTGPTFRPLADVEAEIAAWVAGYPGIGGIWLDEFYPRYEIAGADGVAATFPNGQALAPTDRSFLNADGTFNAKQVVPAGGYYDQLTSWIHGHYPGLKIIGNAGGQFYSNQINYTDLVDITCSFEQTYSYAANAPTNDWANLNRQNTTTTHAQLALIHTNTTDLAGAVSQAFAHGYQYVHTTSRALSDNLWGGIPPYFTSEAQLIGDLP